MVLDEDRQEGRHARLGWFHTCVLCMYECSRYICIFFLLWGMTGRGWREGFEGFSITGYINMHGIGQDRAGQTGQVPKFHDLPYSQDMDVSLSLSLSPV